MQERRKHPRISVDLPVTVLFPHQHAVPVSARMIELSIEGMRFVSPIAPEINSDVELRFSLPAEHFAHEIKLTANVRYIFDVLATPGTKLDYLYVVGVYFMNLQEDERVILDRVLKKSWARIGS